MCWRILVSLTLYYEESCRDEKLSQKLKTTQPDDIDLHFQVNIMLFDGITFGSCLTYLLLLLFPAVSEPLLFFPFAWQANNREISQDIIYHIHPFLQFYSQLENWYTQLGYSQMLKFGTGFFFQMQNGLDHKLYRCISLVISNTQNDTIYLPSTHSQSG